MTELLDPTQMTINPGLGSLPRQIGLFPNFRLALLAAAGRQAALKDWRGRAGDDYGVMLLEMWAYVSDVLAFYDKLIADESYLRTASQRAAVQRLVALLGYLPRPAVASMVDLALEVQGRRPVVIPAGTAFRSAAFEDEPPQVFETAQDVTLHPFYNRASIDAPRAATIGSGTGTQSFSALVFKPGTVTLRKGNVTLLRTTGNPAVTRITAVENIVDAAGSRLTEVSFSPAVSLSASTLPEAVDVTRATQTGSLWIISGVTGNPAAIETVGSSTTLRLDGLYRRIKAGDDIVLSKGAYDRWFSVESISERTMNLINAGTISVPDEDGDLQTVTVPPVTTIVTELKLDATIDSRKASGDTNWTAADAPAIVLHYAIVEGGQVTTAAQTEVESSAALQTSQPPEKSALSAAYWPTQFILRDKNDAAVAVSGTLGEDGSLTLDPDSAWTGTLVAPLKLYGNVLQATRGEQVTGEILGSGDGSLANQTFTLKNNPLTYLSAPTQDNPQGVASTLTVWVNGIQWQEVPRFYGIGPDEMVYIVRQNSDGESSITFGDGSRGARLPTGSGNVVADYRFGAGAASPPALSITQVVKPIKGLNTVNNPVPAYGGADAESEEQTRQYAPRSALMLGRAVSLLDFEAVVANVMGVTAVTVDWRWNTNQQRPLVQVWYIGDANLKDTVLASLRAYSELNTPFDVQVAQPQPVTLTLDLLADPRYVLANVISAAQEVLLGDSGILLPQNIGISGTFFRSPLLAALSAVEGLVTVRALLWDGAPLPDYGVRAPAGYYFEFKVSINGEAVS